MQPLAVAAVLVVLPPMTAGFSCRYVPLACLAAGLAGTRKTRSSRKAAAAAVRAGADETAGAPASLTRLSEHGSVSTAQ